MTCYLETRCRLALLYALLFQYRLREAQGLCDRLARQLQTHAGRQQEETAGRVIITLGLLTSGHNFKIDKY